MYFLTAVKFSGLRKNAWMWFIHKGFDFVVLSQTCKWEILNAKQFMVVEEVICWEQTHHKSSRNRYLCFNCVVQKMIEKCELWIFQNNILDIRNAFVSLYACVWYFSFIIQSDQSKILWTFLLCFCPLSKIFTMIYKLTRQKALQCL